MKRILVPTDFSKTAEQALKVAAQIARINNSEIIILHMLELPQQQSDALVRGKSIPEIMLFKDHVLTRLDELMDADYLKGISVSKSVQFEKAFEGIVEVSKKNDIDLIVMGSNGTSGLHEMFIGSNTEKVVRTADVPVLVIKHEMDDFKTANFVFASDFSRQFKAPFQKLKAITDRFNSHIHLVTICTPGDFKPTRIAQKAMDNFVADLELSKYSTHIYNDSSVEKGVR